MRRMKVYAFVVLLCFGLWLGASAEPPQCGPGADSKLCPDGLCCSRWGFCGSTDEYCSYGCQGQCWTAPPPPPGQNDVTDVISADLFEEMLVHRNDPQCEGHGFYSYDAFVAAARSFDGFATTGNLTTRKREIAAFFAQTSHETTGGWPTAPGGPYEWGYCFIRELSSPDEKYYGRGPIQLTYKYNYALAGEALGIDLVSNPDLVATDAIISFKTAIWFWMAAQANKPSSHDVIMDEWHPSANDIAAGRLPGYGVITNIINGGLECGFPGPDPRVEDRIGFYKRYCDIYGIEYGENLDCYDQKPFNWGVKLSSQM